MHALPARADALDDRAREAALDAVRRDFHAGRVDAAVAAGQALLASLDADAARAAPMRSIPRSPVRSTA